ncbi:MAG: hypothetical protein R3E79_46500 [Caldilineaceae bacterium]
MKGQRKPLLLALLGMLLGSWLMTACLKVPTDRYAVPMPVTVEEIAGGKSMVFLLYQGPQAFGMDDPSKCTTLSLDRSQNVTLGACDGTERLLALGKRFALDWEEIQNRFGSFTYNTPSETLTFTGRGTASGEAWQRAVLAWARTTHAELVSGRASATGRTVMGWYFAQLPDQVNICEHLTVLNYGYAYAETVNCAGGEVIDTTGDWLTDTELAQLDQWLYQRAPLYVARNYLDGQGSTAMNEAEAAAVAAWAAAVRTRIWEQAP